MLESPVAARSAFAGLAVPGTIGSDGGASGVVVVERLGVRLLNICTHKEHGPRARQTIEAITRLTPPNRPRRVASGGLTLIGTAPGRWLVVGEGPAGAATVERVAVRLEGLAAIADQSDAYGVLRLWGTRVRDTLAKGCPIDLHPSAFGLEDAATVPIATIPCRLWQVDHAPAYDVLVPRSYALSFWDWLKSSAAEFGFEVQPAG